MIPIKINVDELAAEFHLSGKDVSDLKEEILSGLCNELVRNWSQQAREKLKSTRSEYIRSLKVFREGKFKGGVELIGWLPNRIESGLSPFDMKIGMLKSNKTKKGSKGQDYITVPFRIGIPSTLGESQIFTNIMSPAVYKIAKSLQGKETVKTGQLPSPLQIPQTREFIKTQTKVFEAYTHKAPIFTGIQKGQGAFHGQYHTFRRISSSASDPNSWIHTGIQAYKLADRALKEMDVVIATDQTIDRFLAEKFS